MPPTSFTSPLEPGKVYHLYNRGNNREDIFRDEGNYEHFLKLYAQHIMPIAETYCYCLMRNHFHLLLRIRESRANLSGGAANTQSSLNPSAPPDRFQTRTPSQAFSNLFNAYARALNKTKLRTGALFERPFKRIEVNTETYFTQLMIYIHQNPQKHGFVKDFRDWKWSSYDALIADKPTHLQRDDVLGWFGGLSKFMDAHQFVIPFGNIASLAPEDFD